MQWHLDGINDYVNLGNPTALQLTGSMTVSAWINSSSFPVDDAAIVSKRTGGGVGFQLDTTIDKGTRTIGFKLTNSSGGQMFRYGATTLQPNTWYTSPASTTPRAQTLNVYLNGQLDNGVLQGTVTASQQNSTANVNIGQRSGIAGYINFNGRIDDVRIYSRALTQAQIQTDMVTPLGAAPGPDTVAPSVPTGLVATPVSTTQINLSWNASTDNVGVTGYQVFRNGQQIATTTTTSFSNTGLTPATTYQYAVRASDAAGNTSALTTAVSATTPAARHDSADGAIDQSSGHDADERGERVVDGAIQRERDGVDAADFALVTTGSVTGATITTVSGSGSQYTVTASTGTGNGTLGLNLVDNDTIRRYQRQSIGRPGRAMATSRARATPLIRRADRDDQSSGGPSGSDEHEPDQLYRDIQRDGHGLCRERHQLCGQHGGRHAHGGGDRDRHDVQRGGVGDDGGRQRGGERPGRGGDGCGGQPSLASTSTDNTVTYNVSSASFFRNEILATGFNLPTAMKFLPDGRMLVAELGGTIKVLSPPYTQADPTPFLQLTNVGPTDMTAVQQGIYDIALDPNFTTNHYYYVFYTAGTPNRDRLSRFTANATLTGTVPGSEFILYEDPQNADAEHHGGAINFGNDGKIYFTTGDHFQGSPCAGSYQPARQDPAHQPGRHGADRQSVLRRRRTQLRRHLGLGLRNPYRAYYDAPTGRLLIGDVGGNDRLDGH